LNIDGSETLIEGTYIRSDISSNLTEGARVSVEGYFMGYDTNGYVSFILTKVEKVDVKATAVSVSADKTNLTLPGETAQLTSTLTPTYATDKVTYEVQEGTSVVSVSETGLVTALEGQGGTAKIVAKAGEVTSEAITITVTYPSTATVQLVAEEAEIEVGKTTTVKSYLFNISSEDKTVTYTSSDETVATVDSNGVVTAVKAGTATITGTVGGVSGTVVITVKDVSTSTTVFNITSWGSTNAATDQNASFSNITVDNLTKLTSDITAIGKETTQAYYNSAYGIKLGGSSKAGELYITTAKAVESVSITFTVWKGDTASLKVNNVSYSGTAVISSNGEKNDNDYTFVFSEASNEIKIETGGAKQRVIITKLVLNY